MIKMKNIFILSVLLLVGLKQHAQSFYDLNTVQTIQIVFTQSNWDQLLDAQAAGAGNYIMVQTGNSDQILIRKLSATPASSTLTVSPALPAIPADGATVSKLNVLGLGSNSCAESTFIAAKIVGTLADCSEVVLLLPKVKVTKGFALAFNSGDFQNLPLELTVYDLLPTDPHYAAFSEFGNASAMLLTPK